MTITFCTRYLGCDSHGRIWVRESFQVNDEGESWSNRCITAPGVDPMTATKMLHDATCVSFAAVTRTEWS
jgi:hypothetical protein